MACLGIYLLRCDVVAPCSLLDIVARTPCFKLVFPPLVFLWVWEELSKFKFFKPNLESEIYFFQSLFVDEFFYYPCIWEILVDNVFVCCA